MQDTKLSRGIIKLLLLGLVLLNLAVVLFAAFQLTGSKQQFEKQAATATQNLSQVLEKSISGVLANIDLVMLATVDEVESQLAAGRLDGKKIHQFLKLQHQRVPDIFTLRVMDANGDLLYDAENQAVTVINYADRDYFQQQRDNPHIGLVIGKPVLGKTTKKWLIAFSRAITKPDGSFAGIASATINLEHFSDIFSVVDVGRQGAIVLFNQHLQFIATNAGLNQDAKYLGKQKLSPAFMQAYHSHPNQGTYVSGAASFDGISRMLSYRRFDHYPLFIVTGITDAVYLSGWHKQVFETSALVLAFILASSVFSFFLVHLLRRQQAYEKELYRQKEYLKTIFEAEPDCVKILAPDGSLVDMNPTGLKMLQVASLQEAQQLGLMSFVETQYQPAFMTALASVCAGNIATLEFGIKGKNGARRWVEMHATPLLNSAGRVINVLAVAHDISSRKLFELELERRAHIDYLTGLYNRGYFMQQAEAELARSMRYNSNLSIFMLDVDFFKLVNDKYGHKLGDVTLQRLTDICRGELREVDIIGRLGGEEFAVLLPETGADEAFEVAERLRLAVAAAEVATDKDAPIKFTVSIGVSTRLNSDDIIDTLLARADKALYLAKETGRNKVCIA